MSAFSNYMEEKVVKWSFSASNSMPTQPTSVWISLHTADPGETGASNEVSGGNYARRDVSLTGGWTVDQDGNGDWRARNANTIQFPSSGTVTWTATVSHFAIWDANSGTPNCLYKGVLQASKSVSSGDIFQFLANNLTITLQ